MNIIHSVVIFQEIYKLPGKNPFLPDFFPGKNSLSTGENGFLIVFHFLLYLLFKSLHLKLSK